MKLWYGSLWCLLLSAAALAAGYLIHLLYTRRDEWKGHTTGKIVALNLRPAEDGQGIFQNRYFPVVEFYAGGKLVSVEAEEGSWPSAYTINQEVQIDYDPDNPEIFQIGEQNLRSRLPLVLYITGSVFLMISILLFLRYALR